MVSLATAATSWESHNPLQAPGLQEAAAARFDELVIPKGEKEAVEKVG